jgi:colanic acid biosynthesis protein WcaH
MSGKGWIEESLFKKIRQLLPTASVDILAVNKGKLLLMLRNSEPAKDKWFTPGGRIRYGETLEQAVLRKLLDETGLKAMRLEKKGVMEHFYSTVHYVTVFFRVDVEDDKVVLNEEHRAFRWITELEDSLHPYVKQMITDARIFV